MTRISSKTQPQLPLALRMDDIGAATKRWEVYSRRKLRAGPLTVSGNFLFLKYLPGWKAWGPYRELRPAEIEGLLELLADFKAGLTLAITAAWVNWDGSLTPFPQKYPALAAAIREGVEAGIIEIADHGLTHCLLKDHAFRPAWRHSNRKAHREFWAHVPLETQDEHIRRAQDILQEAFRVEVTTFTPPGNLFTADTLEIAARHGLKRLSCGTDLSASPHLTIIPPGQVMAFHDRELVLDGLGWLRAGLEAHPDRTFCRVIDLDGKAGGA